MPARVMKYNPAFLTDDELISGFVVRLIDLELILETICENASTSNQHVLVVGPRGIGKTMLVLRIAAEIRRDDKLWERWYPIVFGEESYQVNSPGEFWLEALFHLAKQTKDERWSRTYDDLNQEQDEARLRERALAQLMDFADEQGKRLLLIVENLNMLLGDQLSDDDAWVLRHTLQNEPRLMLLGSSTVRFDMIENASKAMYDLFRIHELKPLDDEECRTVWKSVTGEEPTYERIRPIQILTGGNPRLLLIVSHFAAKVSLSKLMDDLIQLVDDHTEYFKSHLDGLPVLERKVFVCLADLWAPTTAREVADAARIDVNRASSVLNRLVKNGAVSVQRQQGRRKWYQVAERMYNIYHLMRRRGHTSTRIKDLIRFMVAFFREEQLAKMAVSFAQEACQLSPEDRRHHFAAYEGLMTAAETATIREEFLHATPRTFFELPDMPESLRRLALPAARPDRAEITELINVGVQLEKKEKVSEAEEAYRKAIDLDPKAIDGWFMLGRLLHERLEQYDEAEKAYRKAIELEPGEYGTREALMELLMDEVGRPAAAVQVAKEYLEHTERSASSLNNLALTFLKASREGCIAQAETWARQAVEKAPREARYDLTLVRILSAMGKWRDAIDLIPQVLGSVGTVEASMDEVIDLFNSMASAGYAREALDSIRASGSASALAPLVVGLQLFLGEEVTAPQEVVEVGKDVARRIEEYRKNAEGGENESVGMHE